jgi:hypothetical protein
MTHHLDEVRDDLSARLPADPADRIRMEPA